MERLKNLRVYLAGPMDRCPNGGKQWRQDITPFLQNLGIVVLDPTNKPTKVGIENRETRKLIERLKQDKKFDEISTIVKQIRCADLRMVDLSDFLIVNWDLNISICGTAEEIFWGNRQKKPILIHCPQGKNNIPNWLYGTLPHQMFFSNWTELKEYILWIHSCNHNIPTYNRWWFFDLDG